MYLIYNIHSKTLSITPRTIHENYSKAVESLKQQVEEYVTKYKGQSGFKIVHSYDEIAASKDVGYFLHFSEEYNNRIAIYEKKAILMPGWVYNGHDYKILESTTFSMMELPIEGAVTSSDSSGSSSSSTLPSSNAFDVSFISKMRAKQESMAHGGHVKYIEELKIVLRKKGITI